MKEREVDAEKELFDFLSKHSESNQWTASTKIIVPQLEKYEGCLLRSPRQWVARKLMHHVRSGIPLGNWKIELYGKNSRGYIYRGVRIESDRKGTVP